MRNVEITNGKDELVIKVKLTRAALDAAELSNTGRTRLLATTAGAAPVACNVDGLRVALNVMIPR